MWRALAIGLPTINGHSGWAPPGWDIVTVDDDKTQAAAMRWADQNAITGLCAYDEQHHSWQTVR